MKRIYHPYWNWEDFKAGMWRNITSLETDSFLKLAIEFTGNAELYGQWMLKVIEQWPIACEHNLSCPGMNRQAWIGHSACCMAINCPEQITRLAWHNLTQEQRNKANEKADFAIKIWEERYA
jgi:hypothetical protein